MSHPAFAPEPNPDHPALHREPGVEPTRVHRVTTACIKRRPVFADPRVASIAADTIADPAKWLGASLLCWVLMPDHWQGLIRLHSDVRLASIVASMKGRAARAMNAATCRKGVVWMPGFSDHPVHEEQDVLNAARYLVANPKRAGLVRRIDDYPYWDAVWLDKTRRG